MAYVDQNGLILIDDIEVAEDITKLKNAMNSMDEALDLLKQMNSINGAFSGDTAEAIASTVDSMIGKINQQKEDIEAEIRYINSVVEMYKTIDANMRDHINSTLTGDIFNNG